MTPEPDPAPSPSELPSVSFHGFRLASCRTGEFIQWVIERSRDRTRATTVSYLNAHTFNLACDRAEFGELIRRFDLLYPDGKGVVWAARWLGADVPERINAADFIGEVFRAAAGSGLKIALLGGRAGEAERFAAACSAGLSPKPSVVFTRNGYFGDADEAGVISAIGAAGADLVLVGMGSPRQEEFVARAAAGRGGVWWCVGALFEYASGTRRRAPGWMRRVGLEWAFRLAMEPGRLWRRYVIGNPKFILRVLRSKRG